MRLFILLFIISFSVCGCVASASPDFCQIADPGPNNRFVGTHVSFKGEGHTYSDADGTKLFIFSKCDMTFANDTSKVRFFVLLSDIEEGEIVTGRKYRIEGVLQRVEPLIYDGPVYGFKVSSPNIIIE